MPLGVGAELDPEEAAALEALRDPNEQPLEGDDEGAPPADTTSESTQDPPQTSEDAPKAEQPQDAPKDPPKDDRPAGDPHKAALRAARAAEARAKREAERLRRENEELKQRAPAAPQDSDELTDEDVETIAADFPALAKVAKAVRKAAVSAPAPAAPQGETTPEFVPVSLPEELQEAVDATPDLLAWQHNPDQTAFDMAKAVDVLLDKHPKWGKAPLAERFAEVVKRVKQELADAPAAPRADVQAALDNAPVRTPRSVGEIGGGSGRQPAGNDLSRFSQMSTDDVEAELMARG